jgi:hypothetical protein
MRLVYTALVNQVLHEPADIQGMADSGIALSWVSSKWADRAPGLKTIEDATEIRRRVLSAFEKAERATDPAEQASLAKMNQLRAGAEYFKVLTVTDDELKEKALLLLQRERELFLECVRGEQAKALIKLFKSISVLGKWPKNRLRGQVIFAN